MIFTTIISARVNPSLIEDLKIATGKEPSDIIKEGLSLLSEKYISNTSSNYFEFIDLHAKFSGSIITKVESGDASKEDILILDFYTKIWELNVKLQKKLAATL